MFRRFTQIITSIAKAASPATPLGGVARDQKISSAGYEAYRKAVEDLSEGTEGLPGDIIDVPTISDLKGEPTAALTRQELEILGNAYVDGVPQAGVESDIAKSFEYWTAAGELGSLSAKFSMASCYFQGVGVPQDCAKAIGMLEELAEKHNFGEALSFLGKAYLQGMGTEKDPSKAYKYLVRAVTAETPSALVPLATCYEKGIGCEPDAEKVVSLYEFACDLGNPEATFKVAMWYSNGVNVEQDQARALALHRRNAAVGYEASMYNAGWHYLIGVGTEKDNKQAAHYFGMAAERGSIEGAINLAGMQRDGLGFKKSDESAIATLKHFSDRIPELTELVAKMEKGDSLEEATITEGIPPQGPRKS